MPCGRFRKGNPNPGGAMAKKSKPRANKRRLSSTDTPSGRKKSTIKGKPGKIPKRRSPVPPPGYVIDKISYRRSKDRKSLRDAIRELEENKR